MIVPSQRLRVFVSAKPVDFRKGHDGLAAVVKSELGKDPFTGAIWVFRSRRADRAKILYYDGSGLVLIYKRLEEGSFRWPPIRGGVMKISHAQFQALFEGMDWRRVKSVSVPPPRAVG